MEKQEFNMVAAIIVVAILAVLTIIFVIGAADVFAKIVVHPNANAYEFSRERILSGKCTIDPFSTLEGHKVEEFRYASPRGYNLFGRIIRADEGRTFPDGKQRTVILCHGWTSNHVAMLTYGKIYQELGFNIVAYDHRCHGQSDKEGLHCTMGLIEHQDLIGLADYVRQFFPEDTIWGLQGESMGSATVMLAAPLIPWLSFAVEDCGYSTMRKEMCANIRTRHLPKFPIVNVGSVILKKRYNLDMDKVCPEKAVAQTGIPMLFCHGGSDTFVPTKMVYDVFDAKKDKKKLHIFEGSEHAESIWDHTDEYRQVVKDFLTEFGII